MRAAKKHRRIRLRAQPARQNVQAVPAWADADRIHQVVTNLLTNALKYAPADRPVDVRVRVRRELGAAYLEGRALPVGTAAAQHEIL